MLDPALGNDLMKTRSHQPDENEQGQRPEATQKHGK